jgi:hypothetical protein
MLRGVEDDQGRFAATLYGLPFLCGNFPLAFYVW